MQWISYRSLQSWYYIIIVFCWGQYEFLWTLKTSKKHNTICVGHNYVQTNTNNVDIDKTCALLQTTGGKDEPNLYSWSTIKSLWDLLFTKRWNTTNLCKFKIFIIFLAFLWFPITCLYVLNSVLWGQLRFPHTNDVRFVFTPSCLISWLERTIRDLLHSRLYINVREYRRGHWLTCS
jgi:hypothetical protein